MLFNSLQYLLFLPAVFVLFWLAPAKLRVPLLLVASYVFYMSWRPEYGLLIFGLTLSNFLLVPLISKARSQPERKSWLALVITGNLLTLGVFKYAQFALDLTKSATHLCKISWNEPTLSIILPLGISFFVFEFIHYAIDVYRGKPTVGSLPDFMLFASFFPTQIAGPIKRYMDFIPQLAVKATLKWDYIDEGIQLILLGLVKKVLIADQLALVVQCGFGNVHNFSGLDLWLVAYAFAFQIFYDFSGYTDIARGSALLFGYKVPINFNLPYLAANVSDFWHRWHISLSTWLRDYLYIPMGGSRCGRLFNYRNLFLTMTLGGLWHGASLHFLIWGAYQGLLLILHKEYLRALDFAGVSKRILASKLYHAVSIFFTFQLVCVGWVLFRADDLRIATRILQKMFLKAPLELLHFGSAKLTVLHISDPLIFPALLLILPVLIVAQPVVGWLNGKSFYLNPPLPIKVVCMLALLCLLVIYSSDSSPKFIYFQF